MDGARTTVVSAPGKVLLTGGYLVLQQPHAGLVLSLSSRFFARVTSAGPETVRPSSVRVVVESPQFGTTVEYEVVFSGDEEARCLSSNPYVSNALRWALLLARSRGRPVGDLRVVLRADNDFYSMLDELKRRNLPLSSASLASLPPHLCLGSDMGAMRKTGLGSSAALVTSLVAAVATHFGAATIEKEKGEGRDGLEEMHQLAQFAHCLAQGKIGSGFDVASACFGSQEYVRFSPSLLDPLLRRAEAEHAINFSSLFRPWDGKHSPRSLPPGLSLVLGDVSVGSNTPLMVGAVLAWAKREPEQAAELWREIDGHNRAVVAALEELRGCGRASVEACGEMAASEWREKGGEAGKALARVREEFGKAREGLKRMGERAGTAVEPDTQTRLCDASQRARGVVCCGVPGAGGEDAVVALVVGSSEPLEKVWREWREATVLPMLVREDARGLVREE